MVSGGVFGRILVLLLGSFVGVQGQCSFYNRPLELTAHAFVTGNIYSPGYNGSGYRNDMLCSWRIKLTTYPGYAIKLEFEDLQLETHSDCTYDYVQIFDSESELSVANLGRFCSDEDHGPVFSSGQYLYIVFKSDSSTIDKGFHLSYTAVNVTADGNCGSFSRPVQLVADSRSLQYFSSPNYPAHYLNDQTCVWHIRTEDPEYVVRLQLSEIELEETGGSGACQFDYITVYSGSSQLNPSVVFCTPRPDIHSQGQDLLIAFHSDVSKTAPGFRIGYQAVLPSGAAECANFDFPQELVVRSWEPQYITSVGYPSSYPIHARCAWRVKATTSRHVIQLDVIDIDLDHSASCSLAYIKVYDGDSDNSRELRTFCEDIFHPVYSNGQYMFIEFISDGSVSKSGFKLKVTAVQRSEITSVRPDFTCGSPLNPVELEARQSVPQYFTSPGYPQNYPDNSNCAWRIKAPDFYVVKLTFLDVDMEESSSCSYDSITVVDGYHTDGYSPVLRKLCSPDSAALYSSGVYMYIQFRSDQSGVGRGFRLSYTAVLHSSVTTTTTSSYDYEPWRRSVNSGAIIGGLIGGISLLVIFVGLCCLCMRQKHAAFSTPGPPAHAASLYHRAPTTTYSNNNTVFMMTAPTSGHTQTFPETVGAASNPAYSSVGDAPPSYNSLELYTSPGNVDTSLELNSSEASASQSRDGSEQPSSDMSAPPPQTASPTVPPPSYSDAMMMTHPPATAVPE